MSLIRGRMPSRFCLPQVLFCGQRRTKQFALIAASMVVAWNTSAQQPIPLTLTEAEDLALNEEPGQHSFLSQAEALREESVAAGQLPDPTMRVGLVNFPIQSGGFTTEGMTQAQLGIRQVFPPGKTRSLTTRKFESLALEMNQKANSRARDVLTAVRIAWLEAYYWHRAKVIITDSRPFFEDLVTITTSLYSVGREDQQDVLRAELELSRLDDRIIEIDKQHARATAALSEWVGENASRPLAERLPSWSAVPTLGALNTALQMHPALAAADARIVARDTGVDVAGEQYKPGWALDLGYGYRDGSLPSGEPRSDFISLSGTVDLPFFRRNRQDRSLAAALSERRAAEHSREELRRRLGSQLESEFARWHDLDRRVDLYSRLILTQAEDQAMAALAAYQSDAGDFADVMRGYIDNLNTQLEHIRSQVERDQSFAVLANLGGIPR